MNAERRQQLRHGARERAELAVSRDGGRYSEARELGRDVLALLDALDQAEKIVNEARELTDCGETLEDVWALSEHDFDVAEKRWGNVRRLVAALAPAVREQGSAPDGGAGAET